MPYGWWYGRSFWVHDWYQSAYVHKSPGNVKAPTSEDEVSQTASGKTSRFRAFWKKIIAKKSHGGKIS